jgi:protein MpaA
MDERGNSTVSRPSGAKRPAPRALLSTTRHWPCWKKTSRGTAIELLASASVDELRRTRPILLMGGVHGDEPEGVRLAEETLQWLLAAEAAGEALCPWLLIPCLNVDGFAADQRVNGRGVDLNRNYPSSDWTATSKGERYNPGPSAASEVEVQGVVELIRDFNPRLIIHCHSWEPCIVATGDRALLDGERLARASGYKLKPEIGYPTPGSLSRYAWHDLKIPVICIEERDRHNGLRDLNEVWPRFAMGIQEIFRDLSDRGAKT